MKTAKEHKRAVKQGAIAEPRARRQPPANVEPMRTRGAR